MNLTQILFSFPSSLLCHLLTPEYKVLSPNIDLTKTDKDEFEIDVTFCSETKASFPAIRVQCL